MAGDSEGELPGGRLAENIMHFARVLRRAGLPVGPASVIDAVRAAELSGLRRRDDFYWALHSVFVRRRDQRYLFDQVFHIFWRNPEILERMMQMMLPTVFEDAAKEQQKPQSKRVAEALATLAGGQQRREEREQEIEIDAQLTWSDREVLQKKDFEEMSAAEVEAARQLIARMRLPVPPIRSRRMVADPRGASIDMRRTLRMSMRGGSGIIALQRRRRRLRTSPLVVLCDISGSMSSYSRMLLHFVHTLTSDRDRVHSFVFGTRLTNITRQMRARDVDEALDLVGEEVEDWSGGTRIGTTLREFNLVWSRRVLGQGAVVLLISDGLDRDAGKGLEEEVERLQKSCRRLIWLNPLLRYEAFEPKSKGIRAILPHVDEFRPVHNLESLGDLVQALSRPETGWNQRGGLAA
ncbi:vWA domain-containing protein [Oceanibacterium hippocampi]|uniref:VWA domain containing CoxE-like protein n=1 Tax=Oceanibacterium hippocampi TaxID=745714 RepID=A0A1Y5TYE1_9PROT|nr:VWA domain-containing protein [Oceanibacterium hippocampi]SLN76905.1 VWA domain containing CoxE-like protein [Oceanibacterium hippocampi]